MSTIHESKRKEVLDTPVLLFECTLGDGSVERWSTHKVTADGEPFEARVLRHGGFEMKLAGEDAVDAGARFTLTLSNADRRISQLDVEPGWKGAKLRVRFGFFNLESGTALSELAAVFAGIANPVEELTETEARLSFANRLSLQRLTIPTLRIQNRCPWRFPATQEERVEAKDGGTRGRYSALYRCGYSAGLEGGAGNLLNGEAYTDCGRTREECEARGMLREDAAGKATARFGGCAFLPPSIQVRAHGEKSSTTGDVVDGRARANAAVPLVYGTAWITAPVIFSRNDGNLTHCEALLGSGPMEGVQKVIANGVELPLGETGRDMTSTGWYNVLSLGERSGGFNLGFTTGAGKPAGDPHGSMACLAVVLPNGIMQQGRLPKVEVLLDGMKLPRFAADGTSLGESFTRNPAWVLLDLFRRAGWEESEINISSFAAAAAECDEFVEIRTPDGQAAPGPRFEVNLALTQRRSLSETARGLRTAAALMVTVDEEGKVTLRPESTLAKQGAAKPASTNSAQTLHGGWPAYEFGDGLNGCSGILRRQDGSSTFRIWRRAGSETANQLSVEFQDAFNHYQQDSLSLVDFEDAAVQGCEVSAGSGALGLPHVDQAARILRLQIDKNLRGNRFVEFETSVQALGLRPGDLIAISHSREGMDRTPFRVLRLSPALNFERARVTAQLHDDEWYERAADGAAGGGREGGSGSGIPRPLAGRALDENGVETYEFEESDTGSAEFTELTVRYAVPPRVKMRAPAPPSISLAAAIQSSGGALTGGRSLYYAVSSVDAEGLESALSFTVRAGLPEGSSFVVGLQQIRCRAGSVAMRVYRGGSPARLRRIAETAPAATFHDTGLANSLQPPPDANFDHARFQWRHELLPETQAGEWGAESIGNASLGLQPDEFKGSVARIMRGRGEGQERIIRSHTATRIELAEPWAVAPDATSVFTIAEAGWQAGGITQSGEIRMLAPNRPGQVVQVLGIAVGAAGAESAPGEAIVGRHRVAGNAAGGDSDVPPEPSFGLSVPGQGTVEIGGIGFSGLENTMTIRTGTLTLHYWHELDSPSGSMLTEAVGAETTVVTAGGLTAAPGDLLQIESELVRVLETAGSATTVERGCHGTLASGYAAGARVYLLARRTQVLAFAKGFFGSPASGSYAQRIALPNVRVAAAEFYVTNDRGHSPTGALAFTGTLAGGLRTRSGGQYSLQHEGELAVTASIAPPVVVEARRAVFDVQAQVAVAPIGEPVTVRLLVDDLAYAELAIAAGATVSNRVSGFGKPPLAEGSRLTAEILTVGTSGGSYPGRDLSITVRL